MRLSIYYLPIFLFPLFLNAQNQQWINYVDDHIIYDIKADDKYLWVGTFGGLVRIDRETEERQLYMPSNSGLKGISIQSIYIAPNGMKWFGGEYGGLMSFDGENWEHFYEINTGDTLVNVSEIKAAPNGDIWFKARVRNNCSPCNKVFRYDGQAFEYMDTIFGPANNNANNISYFDFASNGDAWIIADKKVQLFDGNNVLLEFTESDLEMGNHEVFRGIWVSKNDEAVIRLIDNSMTGSQTHFKKYNGTAWIDINFDGESHQESSAPLIKDEDGNLWLMYKPNDSERTYAKYDGINWESWNSNDLPTLPPSLFPPGLKYVDKEGHMWFTYTIIDEDHLPKVYELDNNSWKGYNTQFYLLSDIYIDDVAFDCNGNTMFGAYSRGSVSVTNGVSWQEYNLEDYGISIDPWTLATDTVNCSFWIGSYDLSNGIVKFDGNNFTQFNGGGGAIKLKVDKWGNLWAATQISGVGKFNGNAWTWYSQSNSPLTNLVWDVTTDHDGNFWAGTYGNGLVRYDGSTWQVFNQSNSPLNSSIYWVYIDKSGVVWVWNKGEPYRYNGLDWEKFPVLSNEYEVTSMAEDVYGNFWFATTDGVYFWDGNEFTIYTVENSPLCQNHVSELKIDPFGNKWFVHHKGVSVFNEYGISNRIINPPNRLSGQVYFDSNQDGIKDPNLDHGMPGKKLQLQPEELITYSTIDGQYSFYPNHGEHEINFDPETPFVPTSPSQLDLFMGNYDQSGFDFGIWSDAIPDSIDADLTASIARCNETTTIWISVKNLGLSPANGTVELTTYPALDFLESNISPESISGNVIKWVYQDLLPYEYDPIKVVFQSPGLDAVGETLEFNAVATRLDDENITQIAQDYTNTEVLCSYDPNDKKSEATGDYLGHLSLLSDPLDFTIRFQNKGNDTAFVVVIRDTLDTDLDFSSFEVISYSHPVRTTMTSDGILTFVFENINLLWESFDEPASHGFVKYRIAPKENLPDPTDIENTAHIYFDFNPAIVTNTTENTLVEELPFTSVKENSNRNMDILIYPNPTQNSCWIEWVNSTNDRIPWNIKIYDLTGRRLHYSTQTKEEKVQIENLNPGFYMISIESGGQMISKKLVVTSQ